MNLPPVPKANMSEMYRRFPDLKVLETNGKHRLNVRRHVLKLAPKGSIGAELGVYTGMFSEILEHDLKPSVFYLVDPWSKLHGDYYPNWGPYSSNLSLSTEAAKAATLHRAKGFQSENVIVNDFSSNWLPSLSSIKLDWVYLDAGHQYSKVMKDLHAIDKALGQDGVIMGDDIWVKSLTEKSEVFYAVRDFSREMGYEILRIDGHGQWAVKRIADEFARRSGMYGYNDKR